MNTNGRTYDVVNGPGKDLLFDACKYAYAKKDRIQVEFDVAFGYTMPANQPGCAYIKLPTRNYRVIRIEHEDGSGESFNLFGYCDADFNFSSRRGDPVYSSYKFQIYFNTKRRKGHAQFIEA